MKNPVVNKSLFRFLTFHALTAIVLLGTIECGHKTALNPPPPRRVAPVEGLSVEAGCGTMTLHWNSVRFDTKGKPLESTLTYLVLRRRGDRIESRSAPPTPEVTPAPGPSPSPELEPESETAGTEYEFRLIGMVPATEPESTGVTEPTRMSFIDTGVTGVPVTIGAKFRVPSDFETDQKDSRSALVPGYKYYYRIQAMTRDGMTSDAQQTQEVNHLPIPAAPRNPTITLRASAISLTWLPPDTACDGSMLLPLGGVFIQRASDKPDDAGEFTTIATVEGAETTEFSDSGFQMDAAYRYRLAAFLKEGKVCGVYTDDLAIDTSDRFPPAPPASLNAVHTPQGVHLLWPRSPDSDVAGYRIYRATRSEGPFQLLNQDALSTDTVYIDSTVASGNFYVYQVTAVDRSRVGNESSPTIAVRIMIP